MVALKVKDVLFLIVAFLTGSFIVYSAFNINKKFVPKMTLLYSKSDTLYLRFKNEDISRAQILLASSTKPVWMYLYIDGKLTDSMYVKTTNWERPVGIEVDVQDQDKLVGLVPKGGFFLLRGVILELKDSSMIYVDPLELLRNPYAIVYGVGGYGYWVNILPKRNYINRFAWDGSWYRDIAINGYKYNGNPYIQQNPNFPPLYPLTASIVSKIFGNIDRTMIVMNILIGFVCLLLLFVLTKMHFGETVAYKTILMFSLYPGFLFFHLAYSEAITIFFVLISLLALMKKRYFLAFLLLGISTAGRFQSAMFLPAFLLIFLLENGFSRKSILKLFAYSFIGISGIVIYSLFLWIEFGDPIAWYKLNRFAWGHLDISPLKLIVLNNLTKALPNALRSIQVLPNYNYAIPLLILIPTIIIYIAKYGMKDRILILTVIPFVLLLTSQITQRFPLYESLTRHVYTIVPFFIAMARIMPYWMVCLICAIFSIMLFLNAMLFDYDFKSMIPFILKSYVP